MPGGGVQQHRLERDQQPAEQDRDGHWYPDRAQHPDRAHYPDVTHHPDPERDQHRDRDGATATATATATETSTPTQATSPAAATGSGTNLLWLWILLGAAALAGLIALIVGSSRRRSATSADWRSRLIDAYAKGSALHDAMSVAEAPGEFGSPNAAARWADIQRRADDLTQTLYSLREAVPDEGDSARVADTLTSLQAVRSAMAAERAAGGFDPRQAEVVRGRLYSFEMSLRALRQGDEGY